MSGKRIFVWVGILVFLGGLSGCDMLHVGQTDHVQNNLPVVLLKTPATVALTTTIPLRVSNNPWMLSLGLDQAGCYTGFFELDHSWTDFLTLTSQKPALEGVFVSMLSGGTKQSSSLYQDRLTSAVERGQIPFITLQPMDDQSLRGPSVLAGIINHSYDDLLDDWATFLKGLSKPVLIRFAHEMNGNWYPWSSNPTLYKEAFRYIVTYFRVHQATNVLWMFSPNNETVGTSYEAYFPGEDVVDLLGLSGYNWGTTQGWSRWKSFSEVFKTSVKTLYSQYNLPIFLDLACTEVGGDKAAWVQDMSTVLETDPDFASVKGFCWFDINKETDWRVDSSQASLEAYQKAFQSPYFWGVTE